MIGTLLLVAFVWSWILPLQIRAEGPQEKAGQRPEQRCGPYAHWDATVGRCKRDALPPDSLIPSSPPKLLSPPPGVIVLRPGGVREQANSCPEGFREVQGLNGWRFCIDPEHPEPIPPLEVPPIVGIPYEEALKILERHREELMKFPGVSSVGLGADGIRVETDNPSVLPREVEGLPIKPLPPRGLRWDASHSETNRIRPLHGGVAVSDLFQGTLTGVTLSQKQPWLIFPTHILSGCQNASTCSQPVLNSCPHYDNNHVIVQPDTVGFVQKWDPLDGSTPSTDVAAAFMDNDTVEGNGSLHADRELEFCCDFTGSDGSPSFGTTVTVVISLDPHILSAVVTDVDRTVSVGSNCNGGLITPRIHQTFLEVPPDDFCFTDGDSGSPVLDGAGRIVGMLNWAEPLDPCRGGGTNAATIKTVLGFDSWYGTQTSGFDLKCN